MKKTVFRLTGLCLAGISFLAGASLLGKALPEPQIAGGTLRVSPFGRQLNLELDPAKEAHVFLMQQLYDGLVRLDKGLSPTPALAEYWMIGDSGRRFTFFLRRGVKFHDGREMTADDVAYSLTRLVDPKVGSPYASNFIGKVAGAREYAEGKAASVSGYRVVSRYVFEMQWIDPPVSALYLLGMSYCKVLPRDQVQAQGRDFFARPVGTGPFKFSYWMRGPKLEIIGVRLERNGTYYDRKALLDAVEFSPFFTLDGFRQKDVDIYPFVSASFASLDCQIKSDGALSTVFLGMSCHLAPLNQPQVRRALAVGLDRVLLAKAAYSDESVPEPTDNFIPAKLKGFFPTPGNWDYNPEQARRMLAAAGFSGGKEFPPLVLYTSQANPGLGLKVYREIAAELEPLGISLSHRQYRSLRDVRSARRPYLVLIEWRLNFPDPESIIRPLFFSRSETNAVGYSDPRLDKALAAADEEPSFSRRIALFQKIEVLLREDLPAVPLFSNELRMALQPYVKGVEVPPMGFFYLDLRNVWLDKER